MAECESDSERLNVYKGFLLTANLDALFEKGYISFTDDGLIMISSVLEHSKKRFRLIIRYETSLGRRTAQKIFEIS